MKKYLIIALVLNAGCATQGDQPSLKEQWEAIETIEGARTVSWKDRNGDTKEFILVQTAEFDMHLSKKNFTMAKACERYARQDTPRRVWLQSCDKALTDSDMSRHNQLATLFNRALILGNLGDIPKSLKSLEKIAEENPKFSEADFEIARLNFTVGNYSEAIKYANSALAKDVKRPSDTYYILGKSYQFESQYPAARRAYEAGLEKSGGVGRFRRSLDLLNDLYPEQ